VRRPLLALVTTALVLVIPLAAGAHGQDDGGDDVPSDLARARDRATAATAAISRVETELGELDDDLRRLEAEAADAERELERLREEVALVAVDRYTKSGSETLFFPGADLNQQQRAEVLARIVTQADTDAIDAYRATRERLEEATGELDGRRAEQRVLVDELRGQRARLDRELERLETLDPGRRAARRAAAEQAAAAQAAAPTTAVPSSGPGPSTSAEPGPASAPGPAPTPPAAPSPPAPSAPAPPPPPPPSSGGGWICPVQGPMSFVDSWGAARGGGRSHQGVDLMAPRGTPVVTPVTGTVTLKTGGIGGLTYRLDGADGNWYYGAHLDAYAGAQGFVPAGTVVGYVGDTGDAAGTGTHLHFEIHIGGYGNPTNPYPTVARYC
jgi:murein DD-endopeptidase MepM/ murein hydrolase activator NlpD